MLSKQNLFICNELFLRQEDVRASNDAVPECSFAIDRGHFAGAEAASPDR